MTLRALVEGRVEHLVYDVERDYPDLDLGDPALQATAKGLPTRERMIELALSTSARITPIEGDAARELDERDGVAALLRY
jgi:hypothetical protein